MTFEEMLLAHEARNKWFDKLSNLNEIEKRIGMAQKKVADAELELEVAVSQRNSFLKDFEEQYQAWLDARTGDVLQ